VASLVALGALSWRQAHIWRDSETLWSYVVATEPTAPIGHNNLGFSYLNQGRLAEAEREILTALRLSPEWDQAHRNLAALLARQGRMKEAGDARAKLGYMLLKHGKYQAAVELFQKEVAARPDDAAAHNNLGAGLLLRGDVGPAIEQFEHALRIDPGHERARRNLAAARQRR
jgi:Flp pilus assembly protein TadD